MLRREQNRKSDSSILLKEKDEIIKQVMAEGNSCPACHYCFTLLIAMLSVHFLLYFCIEVVKHLIGEELSKKQAAQEGLMKKLRAQIRELEDEKSRLTTKLQVHLLIETFPYLCAGDAEG